MNIESLENRINRNRDDIAKILNAMNEGNISISDAKEAIRALSEINKDLLSTIQKYKEGLSKNTVGNYHPSKKILKHLLTGNTGVFIKEYHVTGRGSTIQIELPDGRIYYAPSGEFEEIS